MPNAKYKGYNLRNKVFWGFMIVSVLSVLGSSILSYFLLSNHAQERSAADMQSKSNALMASLDYAVSKYHITTEQIPEVLDNKIMEIADISKHDVIIYDLKGNYLLSNKDPNLIAQKKVPFDILQRVIRNENDAEINVQEFDHEVESMKTSSYKIFRNNYLEPIGIVYQHYYHDDGAYSEILNRYLKYIILINLVIILFSLWLSWIISKHLTNAITRFSEKITRITLFEKDMQPIKYYHNDELGALVKSYNKMILQIQDQKERLAFSEKEKAWREMAKQVAHEVKNPLTPMKLTIQNFERRFDPTLPDIRDKVKKMAETMVDQIDLVASVAGAFSQFAQLPEKQNEVFNLNKEVSSILNIFTDEKIFVHSNSNNIQIKMDKDYLNRIITNLVTNAIQAKEPGKESLINVDLESMNKRILISVEDNGTGIPEDMLERIFEPNFTSKNSGMGLGLTMVRKMVEDYGGEISVNSTVGRGTKFTISLPANL